MDDLVTRLLGFADALENETELEQATREHAVSNPLVFREAADEIARLTAALAEAEAERDRLLTDLAAWCAEQRMAWVRDAKRNPDTAHHSYGKASSYSAAETYIKSLTPPPAQPEGEHG